MALLLPQARTILKYALFYHGNREFTENSEHSPVNDAGTDYNEILTNAETILRKIYRADPHTDIVFIHTMTRGTAENLASGGEYVSRGAYSTVMHRYGIPQIDVGEALRTRVLSSGGV